MGCYKDHTTDLMQEIYWEGRDQMAVSEEGCERETETEADQVEGERQRDE